MPDRIPDLIDNSTHAMSQWFSDMADSGLIFHPEDEAASIVFISNDEPLFSTAEAAKAQAMIDNFFNQFGDVAVIEAAYSHFMRAAGFPAH